MVVAACLAGLLFWWGVDSAGAGGEPARSQPTAPPAAAALEAGDPSRGEALFLGSVSFRNGGLPCIACHAAGGREAGGALGPDLTRIYADYGEEALAGLLASFSTITMKSVYAPRPLTAGEQADIKAFLRVSAEKNEAVLSSSRMLWPAAGGFFVLAVVPHLLWRGRHRGVRRALLAQGGRPRRKG